MVETGSIKVYTGPEACRPTCIDPVETLTRQDRSRTPREAPRPAADPAQPRRSLRSISVFVVEKETLEGKINLRRGEREMRGGEGPRRRLLQVLRESSQSKPSDLELKLRDPTETRIPGP